MKSTPNVIPDDGLTTKQRRLRPVLMVNTGDGKGKTTAAVGTALRAWAQGWSVGVYQFVKSPAWRTGEAEAFRRLAGDVVWEQMGTGWSWLKSSADPPEAARQGWQRIKDGLAKQRHRFWLLDEFTYPMTWGWVDVDEVVSVLQTRPGTQHVFITGRNCPQPIIELADLVTEMRKLKHPFDLGQKGQVGIEW